MINLIFQVSLTANDMGNLLRREYLDEIEDLSQYLQVDPKSIYRNTEMAFDKLVNFQYNLTIPCALASNGNCSFDDLCSGPCNDNQVIPIFNLIYRNVSQRLHPNFRLTFPTMHLYNDEYYVGEHFAGVDINATTQRIQGVKVGCVFLASELFGTSVLSLRVNITRLLSITIYVGKRMKRMKEGSMN